ncbi:MAG TPA: AAA family ATPase [Actinomycetota bacterium]|nr:AAA family ATPase [Actinomycetota bacterium]
MTKKKKRNVAPVIPGTDRTSRPRPSERVTRAPMAMWDRVKFLLLLGILWLSGLAVVWAASVNPLGGPFSDAVRIALSDYAWILILAAIELVRQLHYWLEEHSKGYFRFWEKKVFGSAQGLGRGIDDWTRFRLARAIKFFIVLLALSTFMGRLFNTDPVWLGIVEAPARLVIALPFILQLAFGFFFVIFQFVGLFWFLSRGGVDVYMPDEIETRFEDVKGQDSVLERVKETMIFLEAPEAIEDKGGYVPGGVLLWGPPGTGKTLMAQAVAGESAKPFVFVDPGAFTQMFMGVGILKVKSLYRKLRKMALRYGGVIVFFDEADSLGNRGQIAQGFGQPATAGPWSTSPACNGIAYLSPATRDEVLLGSLPSRLPDRRTKADYFIAGMGMGGGGMGTLQALLSEMSGLEKPRGLLNRVRRLLGMRPKPPFKYRILHIFATNMPSALDQAMLRPGRIDRQYKVGYPTKEGRRETFRLYLRKVKNELSDQDVDKLATITPYATGASIKDIVNEGLVVAIRDGRETITYRDIIRAKHIKQLGVPDDFEYIERERHATAVHEACHAVVAYHLRRHAVIDIATIERRGDVGGLVSYIPPEDQMFEWRSEREIDVMGSLASLVGERMFFDDDNSSGVGSDLNNATRIVMMNLGLAGMGDTIASHVVTLAAFRGAQAVETGADRNMFDGEFGKQVEAKLRELYDRTWDLLEEHRADVLAVAHVLETHKTVTGDDIAAVMEGTVGPTVDGRPYQVAGFRQMLENYHTAALRAHKEHAGVDAMIPVPVPPPPVPLQPVPEAPGEAQPGSVRFQEGVDPSKDGA